VFSARKLRRSYAGVVRAASAYLRRTFRAVRIAGIDKRIPRPLRALAALGLLPIPGPLDELILALVAVPLALFYRRPLAEAWKPAAEPKAG
jgi:hypothetical protein